MDTPDGVAGIVRKETPDGVAGAERRMPDGVARA
jgi:hypothetical protein